MAVARASRPTHATHSSSRSSPAPGCVPAGELCGAADAVVLIGDGHWLRVPVGMLRNDRDVPLHPDLVTSSPTEPPPTSTTSAGLISGGCALSPRDVTSRRRRRLHGPRPVLPSRRHVCEWRPRRRHPAPGPPHSQRPLVALPLVAQGVQLPRHLLGGAVAVEVDARMGCPRTPGITTGARCLSSCGRSCPPSPTAERNAAMTASSWFSADSSRPRSMLA